MTVRLSLLFSYDKEIFYYSLLCIYTLHSKSVSCWQHGCSLCNCKPNDLCHGLIPTLIDFTGLLSFPSGRGVSGGLDLVPCLKF